jgi:hypothetical protein
VKRLVAFLLPVVFILFASLTGCGVDPGIGPVNQITLAIYTPLCVDVLGASTASGAQLEAYPCGVGKRSQEWQMNTVGTTNEFTVVNMNSQMCMSILDTPDTAPGQHIVQETCAANASDPDQIWTMVKAPGQEAGYQFVSASSKQCLDLPYGATASIFTLQQYYCTSMDPAQGWTLNQVAPGNSP